MHPVTDKKLVFWTIKIYIKGSLSYLRSHMRSILFLLTLLTLGAHAAQVKPCVFCNPEIIQAQSVYSTTHYVVLVDHEPRVKGHLLVVPKRHSARAHELTKEEWEELHLVIPKVVKVFTKVLHTDQYIILEKNGPNAFQQIPHVHFHLLPMTNQAWTAIFNIIPTRLNRAELEAQTTLYRSAFQGS